MKKNRSMSPNVLVSLVIVIAAAVVADPKEAFAQSGSSEGTAATSAPLPAQPPPPTASSAPAAPALPPPAAPPSGPQVPAGQATPPVAYPRAVAPYPPGYTNDPAYNAMYPQRLPYEDGAAVPMGYRKVETRRMGLLIAGTVVFSTFYGLTLFGALVSGEAKYAIPVVGPFLGYERTYGTSVSGFFTSMANFVFIFDGLVQAAGVGMLIAGIPSKTTLVRNDVATFKPEFSVGPGSVSVRMRF